MKGEHVKVLQVNQAISFIMWLFYGLVIFFLSGGDSSPLNILHNFDDINSLTVNDIFISVKTSGKFHQSRPSPILDTWFSLVPTSTWIFSDTSCPDMTRRTGGRLIKTECPSDHSRTSLCCKMEAELTTFLTSDRSWFCHLDDDNYLNVPALIKMLYFLLSK